MRRTKSTRELAYDLRQLAKLLGKLDRAGVSRVDSQVTELWEATFKLRSSLHGTWKRYLHEKGLEEIRQYRRTVKPTREQIERGNARAREARRAKAALKRAAGNPEFARMLLAKLEKGGA